MTKDKTAQGIQALSMPMKALFIGALILIGLVSIGFRIYTSIQNEPKSVVQAVIQGLRREYGDKDDLVVFITNDPMYGMKITVDANRLYGTTPDQSTINIASLDIWDSAFNSKFRGEFVSIDITYVANVTDDYGNISKKDVAYVNVNYSTLARINWSNFYSKSVPDVASRYVLLYDF